MRLEPWTPGLQVKHFTTEPSRTPFLSLRGDNARTNRQEGHDGPGSLTRVIFPTNEFCIFVPLVPTSDPQGGASSDPKGHHVNKIDKGLQGEATYQILKLVFFVPMFHL